MVYRFQSGKHAHFAQSLKVVLTNILFQNQHEFSINDLIAVKVLIFNLYIPTW